MKGSDYFAELYVAGSLARRGLNVYFPHRDEGFDFIISKVVEGQMVIRPVQVKGKYPESSKSEKKVYGYVGKLSQTHAEMVLAIPYFLVLSENGIPACTAYMPLTEIKRHSRGYRCQPAAFKDAVPRPRRNFERFFDEQGIRLLESGSWKNLTATRTP